jgi:tetratricopeptide (TPR) repeat protein
MVGELGARIDVLAPAIAEAGLSNREVVALLRAFEVSEIPEDERLAVLLEKAHELRDLKTKMSAKADAQTLFARDLARVATSLTAGDLEAADAILSQVLSDSAAQVGQSLSDSVTILSMRGDLAHAQANYRSAAVHYERVASAFDVKLSTEIMADQVGSLLEHAARHPGLDVGQEAIRVAEKMVAMSTPGVDQLEALGSLVAALGHSAERGDAFQVLAVATKIEQLEQQYLRELDPDQAPEKWLWFVSDMGSAFNLAARVPGNPRAQELSQKSVRYLRKAVKLGVKHKIPGVYVAQTNLATALRVFADLGSGRRAHLIEAISIRQKLLAEASHPDRRSLSNLCDSLGNDYAALADIERHQNVSTLAQAANAYRRALQLRGKSDLPIDRARTQINLSALYAKAAHAAKARDAKRMWRLSRRWSDIALAGLTPEASPADWQRAATASQWAATTLYELGERFDPAETSKVARTQTMLIQQLSRFGDFYRLFESIRISWILCSNIFEANDLKSVLIIDAFRTVLLSELHAFRFTRFELHLELWEMQAQFASAALRRELKVAEAARDRMVARLRLLPDNPPEELMVDPAALIAQVDEELARLRAA